MANHNHKEFPVSNWAIDNRITIYLLTVVIALMGLATFNSLPKENFPEIKFPVIYVSTPYPGTSAQDIENLVTRKIEKEIKGIKGIKKINSTSIQDFSSVFVEFETNVDLDEAKKDVKDAVDRAKSDLPNDLPNDPSVIDINLSEIPVMFINLSGNFDNVTLKRYAEDLQDELEEISEILRVDIVGVREREVQVNLDLYKMELLRLSLGDIESAISSENVIISGGELDIDNRKIAVRVDGEFKDMDDIRNIVVRASKGETAYLRDIAEIKDGFKDRDSYARLDGKPVVTLNVVKKAGENLVAASAEVKAITADMQARKFPESLQINISGDQSITTLNTLNELTNTIVFGFILVTLVLMFFMGIKNALFVGLAVPLSSFISFIVLPSLGFSMNMVVLFAFILAMGIVVDNAIVVIENTYRIFTEQKLPIVQAAKKAAGEVIAPVFAGTLTTVCPFLPLLFWPGTIGEFMFFLPVVMIITLFASLFVAYVINPVFAVTFMEENREGGADTRKASLRYVAIATGLGIFFHLVGGHSFGNLLLFMAIFIALYEFAIQYAVSWFQNSALPSIKNQYRKLITWSLRGWNSAIVLVVTLVFIFISISLFVARGVKFVQFPEPDPNFVYVYNELPNGTNIEVTDSITRILEERVYEVVGHDNPIIKSMITNVAIGAGDANSFDQSSSQPNKGKITLEFVQVKERNGASTYEILEAIRANVQGIPGAKVTVDKEASGPPGASPVELRLTSEEFGDLMAVSSDLFQYLDSVRVPGVEKLKWDVDDKRPEVLININRAKARELGISSGQIGSALRTAIFGKEVAKYRALEDDYPIQVRLQEKYRQDISSLLNMRITYMDAGTGKVKSVPISSVADFEFTSDYGGINRTDLKKSVTLSSNILTEYNPNDVNNEIKYWISEFDKQGRGHRNVDIEVAGIVVEQEKEAAFLGSAFGVALLLIFMILVTQFNSFSNVLIIISQVLLSVVGVLLGHGITGMDFSIVLSGVGLVVLAGIVVNNGIILLDFFQILQKRGESLEEAVIDGGATRFTPVLLTASSTILGLVPLAISLNINFGTLLSDLNPQIFFGGDSAAFWEPFSWSIIFGLGFATVITLVIVPLIYYHVKRFERWLQEKLFGKKDDGEFPSSPSQNGQGNYDNQTQPIGA